MEVRNLLMLARGDRERKLVRYTASGFTASEARLHYGFSNMSRQKVEACIQESLHIRESINSLCEDQEQSATHLLGIGSDETTSSNDCADRLAADPCYINDEEPIFLIRASQFNWFEVVDTVVSKCGVCEDKVAVIDELSKKISNLLEMFDASGVALLKQSYQAFANYNNTHQRDSNRIVNILNGMIVTDSESGDPDIYCT